MKNVSHRNIWCTCAVQTNVYPPPITLIKSMNDNKAGKYRVKIKLHRDSMSENLDMYEFTMAFFENFKQEEFLLFVQNLR